MVMPAVKSKPVRDLFKQKIFIHGFPKGGKSTLAAQFPGFAFLATEPGLNSLEAWRWEDENGNYVIDSWEKLKVATREAVDNKNCRGIIIDVVDLAYELARDYVCQQNGESYHIDGSLSYGKGTALINNEMRRYLLKLASLNIGIILISHTITEEREGRTGKYTCSIPNLPEKTRRLILGMMDLILFVDFETVKEGDKMVMQRVLRTKPSPHYEAGDRTGILPATIPLDFNALKDCFDKANADSAKNAKSAKSTAKTEAKAPAATPIQTEPKAATATAK